MRIRKPSFYDDFRCIAAQCPDSCCKEWDVAVDGEKAALYRSLPGELGDRLRFFLKEDAGVTYLTLEDGRCPMWRADGLCRIQAELGEQALCKTCREFPRLTHDYGGFVELGLELSCPEAARILLSRESWDWVCLGEKPASGDREEETMALLLQTREEAMGLTEADNPIASLLCYGLYVQELLDGGTETGFDPENIPDFPGNGDVEAFLDVFRKLEILTPAWENRLKHPCPRRLQKEDRAMLRYFISRNWIQAVSDFDLIARVKFLLACVLLVCVLGGDVGQTAQLMSKEIENDAQNVDALLDGAYTLPGLTDANLLALSEKVKNGS